MEYNYQGWEFIIDELKSKQYYAKMPVIFDSISGYLPEMTDFLSHIGVDVRKPYKYEKDDTSDLCYYSFGKAISDEGYEIDFYEENKFVSIAFIQDEADTQRFIVELFGVRLQNPM